MTYLKQALLALMCASGSFVVMADTKQAAFGDTAIFSCDSLSLDISAISSTITPQSETCAEVLKELQSFGFIIHATVATDRNVIYTLRVNTI